MFENFKRRFNSRDSTSLSQIALINADEWREVLDTDKYVSLSKQPEIVAAANKIANMVATQTIYLMSNTDDGDVRIKNGLSRKIDIDPNPYLTRYAWMAGIVRALLLDGDGNAALKVKYTADGLIDGIYLLDPEQVTYEDSIDRMSYIIRYNGIAYAPDQLIHIALNPSADHPCIGSGSKTTLKKLAESLTQNSKTKNEFMKSEYMPSLIVKVDGMIDEFSSPPGRQKLLEKYVGSRKRGEPWLIPADGFDVEQIKPLSLQDLAIKDSVELDKLTVASILDIPPFILGIGSFNADEWNNFVNTRIRGICVAIEQALTKSLLTSPDMYFKFSQKSLYAYDIKTMSDVGCNLMVRGILTPNEVRDMMGYGHIEGGDERVILENYIPAGMIGDQKKLNQTEGGEADANSTS